MDEIEFAQTVAAREEWEQDQAAINEYLGWESFLMMEAEDECAGES